MIVTRIRGYRVEINLSPRIRDRAGAIGAAAGALALLAGAVLGIYLRLTGQA